MFYTEEDVQSAVNAAVKIFGKQGSMDTGKNMFYNVAVFTREFGKLWYGDVSTFDLAEKINALSTTIDIQVSIIDEQFNTIIVPN